MNRETDLLSLKGIGEKTGKLFHKLNLYTVGDLLTFYPRDYDSFAPFVPIRDGKANQTEAIRARVIGSITTKKIRNLTISNVVVADVTGEVNLTFFNMPYLKNVLKGNDFFIFRGLLQEKGNCKLMEQPKIYKEEEYKALLHTLQPRYSLTKGLTNHAITKAVKQAFDGVGKLEDFLPNDIREREGLCEYREAIREIHFPKNKEQLLEARKRLVFDEFFLFLLMVSKLKESTERLENINKMLEVSDTARFLEALPYRLTNAQKRVWDEIQTDLVGKSVMNRLVQGDVGSGKTILAFLSLLMCVANGYQGALMAPTEVLAKQHFEDMQEFTKKYHLCFKPVLLVGSMSAKQKKEAYALIESGEVNVVIGTHALIQEKVNYQKLALVVTDEQHRFGVRQRETLAGKGENVHVLVMSATPIPRTLAIILYGDLDISIVDELPANRLPIKNCVVGTDYRKKAYEFMEKEVSAGHQVYVICPMVEEGELDGVENVMDYTEKLKSMLPSSIQISYLHGKMKPTEKNRIMEDFAAKNIDILVSTTVIEVGINVPNATVMMVENAERFGLAQLHQLRGRVGRGKDQSYCIFMSGNDNPQTKQRLEILNQSNDGFFIAGEDLKLRGPGDIFGIRQSGILDFKLGDIYNDASVLKEASECAKQLLEEDKEFQLEKNRLLKQFLESQTRMVDFRSI